MRLFHENFALLFQVKNFAALSEWTPIIKKRTVIARIRMNRRVSMAISVKSPGHEMISIVGVADVECPPKPMRK
jgi:hypothetical protein